MCACQWRIYDYYRCVCVSGVSRIITVVCVSVAYLGLLQLCVCVSGVSRIIIGVCVSVAYLGLL